MAQSRGSSRAMRGLGGERGSRMTSEMKDSRMEEYLDSETSAETDMETVEGSCEEFEPQTLGAAAAVLVVVVVDLPDKEAEDPDRKGNRHAS